MAPLQAMEPLPHYGHGHAHTHGRGFNKMSSSTNSTSTSSSLASSSSRSERATVLIGPKQVKFKANKKLLCAVSPFFREQLADPDPGCTKSVSLWLPSESPAMFGLFIEWLHSRTTFRCFLDDAINTAHETSHQATREFHWALIHLHLFASHLSIFHLQDLAMDALQDLYLRCDWDVPPSLINYLYTNCESLASVRLRRWAVAMVAFSMASGSQMKFHPQDSDTSDVSEFFKLLKTLPEFEMDYSMHMRKIRGSRLNIRLKNPQLRIHANKLRNDERAFGFRECSFHSHRAAVGQRRCPYASSATDSVVPAMGRASELVLTGLSAPVRHDKHDPFTDFSSQDKWDEEMTRAIKHVRSISSTLK